MDGFNFVGFLLRWVAAAVLVFLTYNPSGWSFAHWVADGFPKVEPLQAVAGIALLGAWAFFVHSTWRALGTFGVFIGIAFFAALVWLFASWGWFSLTDTGVVTWVALAMLSFLLAFGLSWSHVQRRVAGQTVVDEAGDGR